MTEQSCVSVEILKEIPLFGDGDTLEGRLRNVKLKGFPDIKIYEKANFESIYLDSNEIKDYLHTPQQRVYKDHLMRIDSLFRIFFNQFGIDITNLDKAYDFIATSETGINTDWTIIPPIVERFFIPKTDNGQFDYSKIIGEELNEELKKRNLKINPEVYGLEYSSENGFFNLINDGSHRIHYGLENNGIGIIQISNMTPGFPYYAVPQRYNVKIFNTREEAINLPETKIHILESPGHKDLYRLFPSGGIKSGNVRPQ